MLIAHVIIMSMFGGLFDEDDSSLNFQRQDGSLRTDIPRPCSPRSGVRLCGLSNLGATCYMNALLQTMHYTPELREALFLLSEEELGLKGESAILIRAIPVQLQALFSRLLLLDQNSVGVEGLVNSFGWTNNEELQQHDVQELNRILFDALESSLIGTSGEKTVRHLFHGTMVQQITCERCGQVSRREEDFLDLPIPLSNSRGLEQSLTELFCNTEKLEGKNQYHCENCKGLVDAKRGCNLGSLPPVLTLALLRFLYDFSKGERYKDTSRFHFPLELNMAPYTSATDSKDHIYDLFSVVIHGGSTHSGHYTAYIRDVDNLGTWTHPSEEAVSLQSRGEDTDPIDFNSPLELLQAILRQMGGTASLNLLCKHLQDQTGVTWNKRFKNLYGPITKFIRNHSDVFVLDSSSNITLKGGACSNVHPPPLSADIKSETEQKQIREEELGGQSTGEYGSETPSRVKLKRQPIKDKKGSPPLPGHCWYEFNDSHVSSITTDSIEKMFQGKQSAYMLFYRQRNLKRPSEASGNPKFGVTQRLQEEVMAANVVLETERKQYDVAVNTVTLTIHPAPYYVLRGGALQNKMDGLTHRIRIDRRKTISELVAALIQELQEDSLIEEEMVIHTAKHIPAGLHLYDCIMNSSSGKDCSLLEGGVTSDCDLFVWDGVQVGGMSVLTGKEHEPVSLQLSYPGESGMVEDSCGFPKSSSLINLREYFGQLLDCPQSDVTISQVKLSARSGDTSAVLLPMSKDRRSLSDLKLCDGDRLAAERCSLVKKGVYSFAHSVADKQNKLITFVVENRCLVSASGDNYPVHPVEVAKTQEISLVKLHVITQLGLVGLEGGGRLRIDDDLQGLGPPLCEEQTVIEAGLTPGCRLVLERGTAPSSSEVSLRCSVFGRDGNQLETSSTGEVIVKRTVTVRECCDIMVATMGLDGTEWHLRKTNWCGEVGEILNEEEATLEKLRIKSGDNLIIERGRVPPKGFVRISIYLHKLDTEPGMVNSILDGSEAAVYEDSDMETASQALPLHDQDPTQFYPPVVGALTRIGDLEMKRESTLQQLKEMIMTLPAMSTAPSVRSLRVREIVNGRPGKIHRQLSSTFKQLRLYGGGEVSVQLLPFEEDLSSSEIIFYIQLRNPHKQTYGPPIEVSYDTAHSTTPRGLRDSLAATLDMPPDRLALAKHKFEKFKWIRIEDAPPNTSDRGKKTKGRGSGPKGGKRGATHVNIKNSPILLRDGDTIGVKDLLYDPEDKDDFSTPLDDKGLSVLLAIQEEKRRRL